MALASGELVGASSPCTKRSQVGFQGQGTYLGCRFDTIGVCTEGNQLMFLSHINVLPPPSVFLFLLLLLSLKKINKHILR